MSEYQPVSVIHSPPHQKPTDGEIAAVNRDVPGIFLGYNPNKQREHVAPTAEVIDNLRAKWHSLAAIRWALYELHFAGAILEFEPGMVTAMPSLWEQAATATPEQRQENGEGTKTSKRVSKLAQALALLTYHPDWTNEQIAKGAGCNVKYLSQAKKFQAARKALKGTGQESQRRAGKHRGNDMDTYEREDRDDET